MLNEDAKFYFFSLIPNKGCAPSNIIHFNLIASFSLVRENCWCTTLTVVILKAIKKAKSSRKKKKKVIEEQNKPNYDNREIHEHEYSIKLKKKVLYNKQK